LDLSSNQLTALPESLGQLTQLRTFWAHSNLFKFVPNALRKLSQLKELHLGNNALEFVSEWIGQLSCLETLFLDFNNLTALPEALRLCERLRRLFLHSNPELGIPPEVLGPRWRELNDSIHKDPANPRVILDWYFQSKSEPTRRLNEAKMLLVGQGGVGKTSLVQRLIHDTPCNQAELPTEGININDWTVQGKKGGDGKFEQINVHVWDFGGQEIMHATHQFFLTRRSLYLLVIDARAGEKESNIHYWLKIIQSYGEDSPVLVVLNKSDHHPHELNETRLVRDYPNIQGFIATSCETGDGIVKLRREIGKHIRRLPHVFDELPQSYFAVKQELEERAQEKNYLPIEDYREICKRHKVEKPESQNQLIRFLHDLGVVLNFQDPKDPYGQDDHFVLDPEWVTEGVYAILNDDALKKRKDGILTLTERQRILNNAKPVNKRIAEKAKAGECFPAARHGFIMDKMCQFELAYEFDRQGGQHAWLIPELLDPNEPKNLAWNPETSLNFQYVYPVLPAGVICRFIVRLQQYVNRNRSWRSGTVLQVDKGTILVRGDTEKSRVFIAVQGAVNRRKDNLTIVRDTFRYIHSTIPALKPAEEVPLPDMPEISVKYDYLLELEELGEKTFVPPGAGKRYVVTELLNGVDSTRYQNERRKRKREEQNRMSTKHVFVSYCRDNKDDVAELVEDLENAGQPVWWDDHILGGQDWKEAIREAMKNAYAVVICLSPEITEERYRSGVYPEIRDAITTFRQYGPGKTYIFPVRLEKCEVPAIEIDDTRTLQRIQHIDLFPASKRDAGFQKLLDSLATAPGHP
ncbi:MAG: TIR domain-containing protein, partial [Planctomycetaceae bacterium]|nr:TIR domain-containing protein [Planctomycetaceae bacterium]